MAFVVIFFAFYFALGLAWVVWSRQSELSFFVAVLLSPIVANVVGMAGMSGSLSVVFLILGTQNEVNPMLAAAVSVAWFAGPIVFFGSVPAVFGCAIAFAGDLRRRRW